MLTSPPFGVFLLPEAGKGRQGGIFKALKYYEISPSPFPSGERAGVRGQNVRREFSDLRCKNPNYSLLEGEVEE